MMKLFPLISSQGTSYYINVILLMVLCFICGHHSWSQSAYSISPFSGDLEGQSIELISSPPILISDQLTGQGINLNHILFSIPQAEITTAIEKLVLSNNVRVYPNPFRTIINLEAPVAEISSLSIYNLKGERVYHSQYSASKLNLTRLASGVYVLKAFGTSNQQINSFRIIKY